MEIITQTNRFILRELTPEDAEGAYYLNLDPEVVKYTGDVAFESIEAARQFLMAYEQYKKYGFGRWAVIDKTNDEFVGWCGLKYYDKTDEHDIGFRFFRKHWGKGFATETATACLELGFKRFNLQNILGMAMKENVASVRVLQKIGLTYFKDFDFDGHEGVVYKKEKE